MASNLTQKQKAFVDELLINKYNQTAAYMKFYKAKNDATAAVCASQLLRNPKVWEYYQTKIEQLQHKTDITQERVLKEMAAIAFIDLDDYKVIKGVVKVSDKNKALENLGKHLGIFNENTKSEIEPVEIILRRE